RESEPERIQAPTRGSQPALVWPSLGCLERCWGGENVTGRVTAPRYRRVATNPERQVPRFFNILRRLQQPPTGVPDTRGFRVTGWKTRVRPRRLKCTSCRRRELKFEHLPGAVDLRVNGILIDLDPSPSLSTGLEPERINVERTLCLFDAARN